MDQVRTILTWLKKHHFWVLCGLVPLIFLFGWWSGSSTMDTKYDTNQKAIKADFDGLKQVRDLVFHPNQAIIERQDAEKKKQAESVTKLWQQLFDRQRAQVLKWPVALSKAFRDAVEKMQFNDEIPPELRNNYQNYIERHFVELPKMINARVMDVSTTGGAGGEFNRGGRLFGPEAGGAGLVPGALPEDSDYVCEWLDQNVIRDELNFPDQPSSLRIWVTQENLWVYETLLDVIAKTNQAANATRMTNAAVKVVYSLEVGQRAAPYSRQPNRLAVAPPVSAAGAVGPEGGPEGPGGLGGPEGGGPSRMMMQGPGGREGGMGPGQNTTMTPEQEQGYLLSGRYLDDKGLPIPVGAGAAAPGGEPAPAPDPAAAAGPAPPLDLALFGIGYKQLPIRMVLQMDVRWLPQLITACANQPLRVEVQEVRINPPDVAGMEAGGGGGRPGGFGGPGGGGPGANLFPDHSGLQNFSAQPNVVNVVIQGTIFIFNKPNLNLLQAPGAQPVAVQ
jgi:hypothetical protein